MGNSFRLQPGPALYGPNKTPFTEDVTEVAILVAFGIIAFSFLLIIPGIRGWERLWSFIRVFVALWIGAVIVVSSYGFTWNTAEICVLAQYKAYVFPPNRPQEIQAKVGLHIGLRGFNVTLVEEACEEGYVRPFPDEQINYNEEFNWDSPWAQGRFGFGQFAGEVSQEFRANEFRGTPYPILWIAEYFTLDGEQIRWARKFRQAGWYTHIFLWLAFALYLLSCILFIFVISTGAWFMLYTGLIMVLASFSYAIIILNDPLFKIPFGDVHGHVIFLETTYGWAWYLNIVTGAVTAILAVVILILNFVLPREIATFFHHSIVEEDEFFQVEEEEEGGKPSLDEYGVSTRRGGTTRGRTQRRGISKYRQTQRKPRNTVRSTGGSGSRRLHDEIQLQEVQATES